MFRKENNAVFFFLSLCVGRILRGNSLAFYSSQKLRAVRVEQTNMNLGKSLQAVMESLLLKKNIIKSYRFQFLCFSAHILSKSPQQCLYLPNLIMQTCPHMSRDWLTIRSSLPTPSFPHPFLS